MQYTIPVLLAAAASFASAQDAAASASQTPIGQIIPIGGDCVPNGIPCALGANCYATNSMLQPRCGNFQASCTSNQQCAFNTCNGGLCNGFLASSSASSATPTITPTTSAGGFQPRPSSTVTAAPGTLPLGAECNAFAAVSQCVAGVQCWASNSGLIPRCGNFNAACSSNSQCAYNTCNNGLCNGFIASSSARNGTVTASSTGSVRPSSASGNATMTASRSATGTGSGSATRSSSMPVFTGAASVASMVPEIMALMLGAAAWAL